MHAEDMLTCVYYYASAQSEKEERKMPAALVMRLHGGDACVEASLSR